MATPTKAAAKGATKTASKGASKAAAKAAPVAGGLTAYNVKTKEKGVPMQDAVINIKNGRFIAQGVSEGGDKLTAILSQAKAEEAIANGHATAGEGWA